MEKTPKFRPQLALEAGSGLRLLQRYLIVILIPLWMILACQAPSGALFPLPRLPGSWSTLWEPKAFLIVLAWCLLQAGLYLLPLGKVGEGPPMPNGVKLKYNLNGVQAFVITTGLMAYLWYAGVNLAYVYQHYLQLMIAAYTIGLIFSFLLYVKSFAAPIEELVPNANTGNVFVDFYLGRELSPQIGRLNLKFLLMLRIAFLSWVPLNICLLAVASTRWGTPPLPFFLVAIFQILYIFDMMWTEAGEMNTRESTSTGLGYITACGDFTIVPFAYPLQNYFLLHHPQGITVQATIYTILIFIFGFVMYVHSNDQKRSFCKDPNSPKFAGFHKIQTKMGNYLLASGWWGWVRHPHYLGDIIVTMAWSLPCGLSYIVPHLYLFLCIFTLVNRAKVVEQDCHRKYGAAWEEYCRRVKYRFVPFIY